ncbi:MAG: MarR family winged helix-turn-helix transcriptional regulator [Mesorhizobium sp.]
MNASDGPIELVERLARLITNEGHSHGLKPAQWEALRYLARANRFSRTPGGLTAYLGVTKGTVSQTLMALERAGLVEKTANPGDGRSVRLDLSARGQAVLALDGMASIRQALAGLAPERQAALREGLEALMQAALAARGGRAFGICRDCRHFARNARGPGAHFCRLLEQPLEDAEAGQICQEQQAA